MRKRWEREREWKEKNETRCARARRRARKFRAYKTWCSQAYDGNILLLLRVGTLSLKFTHPSIRSHPISSTFVSFILYFPIHLNLIFLLFNFLSISSSSSCIVSQHSHTFFFISLSSQQQKITQKSKNLSWIFE